MIKITFFEDKDNLTGFEISGHSNLDVSGKDIVCAAVSSSAYMTVNTITEILKVKPEVLDVTDGNMLLKLKKEDAEKSQDILNGFKLHITELSNEYSEFMSVNK